MTVTVNGSNGITFNDGSSQTAAASPYGLKNRIINGDMRIDQRNAGTVTVNSSGLYTVDRWQANQTSAGKFSVGKSTVAPAGFTNSYLATSLSAYSVSSSDIFFFLQQIEGLNVADLGWGTSSAQTVTLSFWVRSSLTGTFGGVFTNSAGNRSYPYTYTINSANTWEQKSVTVAGDTTGTWLTDNGIGISVIFGLGGGASRSGTAGSWQAANLYTATGATSLVGTNGATFYITGVQLEVGSTATPFERRMYTNELQLCQRYYWQQLYTETYETILDPARAGGTSSAYGTFYFPVTMRAAPSVANNGVGNFRVNDSRGNDQTCNSITTNGVTPSKATLVFGKATANFTVADCVYVNTEFTNDAALYFNAEL